MPPQKGPSIGRNLRGTPPTPDALGHFPIQWVAQLLQIHPDFALTIATVGDQVAHEAGGVTPESLHLSADRETPRPERAAATPFRRSGLSERWRRPGPGLQPCAPTSSGGFCACGPGSGPHCGLWRPASRQRLDQEQIDPEIRVPGFHDQTFHRPPPFRYQQPSIGFQPCAKDREDARKQY